MSCSSGDQKVTYSLDDELKHTILDLAKPNGCLTKWQKQGQDDKQYTQCLNKLVIIKQTNNTTIIKPRYPYCCIITDKPYDEITQQEKINYETDYKLVIYHENNLYFTVFTVSHDQIKNLHERLWQEKIYLPSTIIKTHTFPKAHADVNLYHRGQELQDEIEMQEEYNNIDKDFKCKGPGSHFFKPREATKEDFEYLAKILEKLINSPSFAIQHYIWTVINEELEANVQEEIELNNERKCINSDLVLSLKYMAMEKIEEWRHYLRHYKFKSKQREPFKSEHKKYNKAQSLIDVHIDSQLPQELRKSRYHTGIIANSTGSPLADHWAVFLEGKYYILFMEYLDDANVKFRFFPNTATGQRVAWFHTFNKPIGEQFFNKRWGTIRKSYLPKKNKNALKSVSFGYITHLVKTWIANSPKYGMVTNNCQHFARNIFAGLDADEAKNCIHQMDQKNATIIFPSMQIADGIKEVYNMKRFLKDVGEYKDEYDDNDDEKEVDQFEIIRHKMNWSRFKKQGDEEQKYDDLDENMDAKGLLIKWNIPEKYVDDLVDKLKEEGYGDPNDWVEIYEEQEWLIEKIGFERPHTKRFKKSYQEWMKQKTH